MLLKIYAGNPLYTVVIGLLIVLPSRLVSVTTAAVSSWEWTGRRRSGSRAETAP